MQSVQKQRSGLLYLAIFVLMLGTAALELVGQSGLAYSQSQYLQQTIPTATPTATSIPAPVEVVSLTPEDGLADVPNEIYVTGKGFIDGAQARLVHSGRVYTLTTIFLDAQHLRVSAPAGLVAGVYDLGIRNPDGGEATLPGAYTVHPPGNDDLTGQGHEFWAEPLALRAGAIGRLGLVVHRIGGKEPLMNVRVAFYQGDPDAGGVLLGEGAIPILSPRSAASTSGVDWTPRASGVYTLYAHIDPQGKVSESLEDNNTVSRTLTVLETALDRTPPVVDGFTIDDGAQTTLQPDVTLVLQATDPAPGRGVASVFLREFLYSQGAERWIPVQESGWLDYALFTDGYTWSLLPLPGVKVVQAWVADALGNVSKPLQRSINYVLETDFVDQGQVRMYRYTLKPGDRLAVQVTPRSGDADLYIWPPDFANRSPWVSDGDGMSTEAVTITAPVGGIYQVEVVGYTPATYRFQVQHMPTAGRHRARNHGVAEAWPEQQGGGEQAATKQRREQPLIPPDGTPDARQGVPAPPAARDHLLWLPVAGK